MKRTLPPALPNSGATRGGTGEVGRTPLPPRARNASSGGCSGSSNACKGGSRRGGARRSLASPREREARPAGPCLTSRRSPQVWGGASSGGAVAHAPRRGSGATGRRERRLRSSGGAPRRRRPQRAGGREAGPGGPRLTERRRPEGAGRARRKGSRGPARIPSDGGGAARGRERWLYPSGGRASPG